MGTAPQLPQADVLDVEIEMYLFRLLRSENLRRADVLLRAAQEDYPQVASDRLNACAARLCRRLFKS